MTAKEKVIAGLKCCLEPGAPCQKCPYYDEDCTDKLERDALDLLKEQEPVKPCVATDTWICPKCGHTLESQYLIDDKENPQVLVHEQYNFCPNCGRAVKWDD